MKTFVSLAFVLMTALMTGILALSSEYMAQHTCRAESFEEGVAMDAGQVLYIQLPNTVASTSDAFETIHVDQLITNASLSPNGSWLALVKVGLENEPTAEVHELHGDGFYSIELEPDTGNPLYWLNDEQFLTVLIPSRMLQANFYPSEIINPFTGERRTVLPYALTFPNTDDTEPLFPGIDFGEYFLISHNGQYGLVFETDGTRTLYDLKTRTVFRSLENLSTGRLVWASDSTRLAFWGRNFAQDNGEEGLHIYDIARKTLDFISDLRITADEESIMLEDGSWSPDANYIAFGRSSDVFGRYTIEILDVSTGDIIETCLTNFYTDVSSSELDFAWSENSRYLASYGLLANEDNANAGTIYIYDVNEGQTYAGFTGDAKLIGWTRSASSEVGQ